MVYKLAWHLQTNCSWGFQEPLQNANNSTHKSRLRPSETTERIGVQIDLLCSQCTVTSKFRDVFCLYLACVDTNCQQYKPCHGDQLGTLTPLRSLTLILVPVKCIIMTADLRRCRYRTGRSSDWDPQEDLKKWAHWSAPSSLKLKQTANQTTPQPEPLHLQSFIPLKEVDVNHFYNTQINHSEMLHQSFSRSPAGTGHLAPSTLWGRRQFSCSKSLSLSRFTINLEYLRLYNYLKWQRITKNLVI